MPTTGKSLEEQIREIQKLIDDASETLAQARWALETLRYRVAADEADGDGD
jgi:hypothetical protein